MQRRNFLSLATRIAVLIACAFSHQPVDAQFKSTEVSSIWISRSSGTSYSPSILLATYPSLKRVYLPVFQFAPVPVDTSEETSKRLSAAVALFRKAGVQVYGVFAPLQLLPSTDIDRKEREATLREEFSSKASGRSLSIYSKASVNLMADALSKVLTSLKLDGVVIDVTETSGPLQSYSEQTRARFVEKFSFDPIDVDYPLTVAARPGPRSQELLELMVNDRFEAAEQLKSRLLEVAKPFGISAQFFSTINAYQLPITARAALLADWHKWLQEDKSTEVILGESAHAPDISVQLKDCVKEAKQAQLSSQRLRFLLSTMLDYAKAREFFHRESSPQSAPDLILLVKPLTN